MFHEYPNPPVFFFAPGFNLFPLSPLSLAPAAKIQPVGKVIVSVNDTIRKCGISPIKQLPIAQRKDNHSNTMQAAAFQPGSS